MQKNSGIVSVVTALSSLLKNMAKGFNEKVTLRQELDFLQNYVIIEKIRYIELFDIDIIVDQEELYDARIIKLTLQPIVENAISAALSPAGVPVSSRSASGSRPASCTYPSRTTASAFLRTTLKNC